MLELTSTMDRLEHQVMLLHQTIEKTCDALPAQPERPLKRPAATTPDGERAAARPSRETAPPEAADAGGTPASQPAAAAEAAAAAETGASAAAATVREGEEEVDASRTPMPEMITTHDDEDD